MVATQHLDRTSGSPFSVRAAWRQSPRPCPDRRRHARMAADRRVAAAAYHVGLDFGTSGARVTVIDGDCRTVADRKSSYPAGAADDWAGAWEAVLFDLLGQLPGDVRAGATSLAIDGTSATAMMVDRASGRVLAPPRLYNEAQPGEAVAAAKAIAPAGHTATASTSALCKLLAWHQAGLPQAAAAQGGRPCLLHQADWLASLLTGRRDTSDWNNALKLGFDPAAEAYPDWMLGQDWAALLPPVVVAPGAPVARLTPGAAQRSGLAADCLVCGGTTDSIAAFVAAGVTEVGQAVTSLGSTMAVKLLSKTRADDAAYGVYSHRLGSGWLVGGASNAGGAVLRQHFTDAQLAALTERIDPGKPTGLDYYPLPAVGERFPVNDPGLAPRLEPRPADDAQFLQGMLEGMTRIETEAYALLTRLGASPVSEVVTAGGGAVNAKWTAMRRAALGVPVSAARQGEASYGAALLARQGWLQARGGAGSPG